jgi:hypothetical protein
MSDAPKRTQLQFIELGVMALVVGKKLKNMVIAV